MKVAAPSATISVFGGYSCERAQREKFPTVHAAVRRRQVDELIFGPNGERVFLVFRYVSVVVLNQSRELSESSDVLSAVRFHAYFGRGVLIMGHLRYQK